MNAVLMFIAQAGAIVLGLALYGFVSGSTTLTAPDNAIVYYDKDSNSFISEICEFTSDYDKRRYSGGIKTTYAKVRAINPRPVFDSVCSSARNGLMSEFVPLWRYYLLGERPAPRWNADGSWRY